MAKALASQEVTAAVEDIARHIAEVSLAYGSAASAAAVQDGVIRIRGLVQHLALGRDVAEFELLVLRIVDSCLRMAVIHLRAKIAPQRRQDGPANDA